MNATGHGWGCDRAFCGEALGRTCSQQGVAGQGRLKAILKVSVKTIFTINQAKRDVFKSPRILQAKTFKDADARMTSAQTKLPKVRHIRTPDSVQYPLTAKEARVVPGQSVTANQGLYVFTLADGRDILIRSPWDGRVEDAVLPEGLILAQPQPFITITPIPALNVAPPEGHAQPETQGKDVPQNQPGPKRKTHNPWINAGKAFLVPFLALLVVLALVDVGFPEFFEDHILARWLLVLMAFLAGVWFAPTATPAEKPNSDWRGITATGLAGVFAVLCLLPSDITVSFVRDLGLTNLFQDKAYGVTLVDLNQFSNGRTPTPSAQQSTDFAEWLNE